ncbi:olfactory receptor 5V1-like [Spea bombifrons]|uniref:olfactory receptor 5V1-like n=1 Tax=Spea bombifrons TaxID=233779 RepID=UPI002349F0E6|nr:olfactory receptor 5V1-like [Spea bombifrons]
MVERPALRNGSRITHFTFAGVSQFPETQALVFAFVLIVYLATLGGNGTIVLLIFLDPLLHTPMYFFLCNLSCVDVMYTTVTLHRILYTFISGDSAISFPECFVQLYFFMSLVGIELLILTAMSYDRYVAICNPLRYPVVMNSKACAALGATCWVLGFLDTVPFTYIVHGFSCYVSNTINHFFCDLLALMKLSCSDTSLLEHTILTEAAFSGLTPFVLTSASYVCIIRTILGIQTATGRRKAFYTCSSHLAVVVLFYVTLSCLYLRPTAMFSLDSDKLLSLVYTAVVPMFNPLIYSLKNKDVNAALKGLVKRYEMLMVAMETRNKHIEEAEIKRRDSVDRTVAAMERTKIFVSRMFCSLSGGNGKA